MTATDSNASRAPSRPARRRSRDLRRRLRVRARAPRLSAGGRVRAGGRARASRSGHAAASRLRPRGLRRRRGAHLLCPPREAARDRPRAGPRADQPPRAGDRQGRWPTRAGTLLAGGICNTNVYDPADPASHKAVRAMFEEQVQWAVDAGVDFIIGETFSYAQEALIATDVDQEGGPGRGDHARDAPGRRHARGLDGGRRLQAHRGRGRRRRRAQLHPRPGDDDAAAAQDSRSDQGADGGAAGALPHLAGRSRRSSRCATRTTRRRASGRSRSRSIRSPATASRSPTSAARRSRSASAISACAAAPARITSARSPSPWASIRRRAGIRPTCRSTRSWARTSGSRRCRRTTPESCRPRCGPLSRAGNRAGRSRSSRRRCRHGSAATSTRPVGSSSVPAAIETVSRSAASQNSVPPHSRAEAAPRARRRRVPLESARLHHAQRRLRRRRIRADVPVRLAAHCAVAHDHVAQRPRDLVAHRAAKAASGRGVVHRRAPARSSLGLRPYAAR